MAEHLASIFGTEKDRVNCPFYFKVCVWVVNALFLFFFGWGKKEISISLSSLFSLLSARSSLFLSRYAFSSALSLSLSRRARDSSFLLLLFLSLSFECFLSSLTRTILINHVCDVELRAIQIGACRHGERCSRLHNKPTVSQTLLLINMYQVRLSVCARAHERARVRKNSMIAFRCRLLLLLLFVAVAMRVRERTSKPLTFIVFFFFFLLLFCRRRRDVLRLHDHAVAGTSSITRRQLAASGERDGTARDTRTLRRFLPRRL